MSAFVLVLLTSFFSDRIRARGPFMIGGCLIAIAGYIMLLAAKKESVRYGGTFLVAAGVYPGSPMVMVKGTPFRLQSNATIHTLPKQFT